MKTVHKEKRTTHPQIGFYGCVGKVVCVRTSNGTHPRNLRLKCPACKHWHSIQPFWRKWMDTLDQSREIAIVEVHDAPV